MKKILYATLGYTAASFALAAPWHFVWFKDAYAGFGLYNRAEPIIPLGVLSMLIQGAVMTGLYSRWRPAAPPVLAGLQFGWLMGLFLFSVTTLANAAKMEVNSLPAFVAVQFAFHLLQFSLAGVVFGLIFGRAETQLGDVRHGV